MPNCRGGIVPNDDAVVRGELSTAIEGFKRKRLSEERKAALIDDLVGTVIIFREMEQDSLTEPPHPAVENYLKKLDAAREAYFGIPEGMRSRHPHGT